jgi:hypothetical protein
MHDLIANLSAFRSAGDEVDEAWLITIKQAGKLSPNAINKLPENQWPYKWTGCYHWSYSYLLIYFLFPF